MTDPRIEAARKAIEGPSGDYELGLLLIGWGDAIIPTALDLAAAAQAMSDPADTRDINTKADDLDVALDAFLAALPPVEERPDAE